MIIHATGSRSYLLTGLEEVILHTDQLHLSPITNWCSTYLKIRGSWCDLAHAIWNGDGKGISDGSYYKNEGLSTTGWIIYVSSSLFLEGGGRVPGSPMDDSSYRGELGGLLSLLSWLKLLEIQFPPPGKYPFQIGCDGDSALDRAIDSSRDHLNCSWKCFDLLSACIQTRESSQARLNKIYVEGHADDDFDRELTLEEHLNVRADEIAENTAQLCISRQTDRSYELPTQLQGCVGVSIQGH